MIRPPANLERRASVVFIFDVEDGDRWKVTVDRDRNGLPHLAEGAHGRKPLTRAKHIRSLLVVAGDQMKVTPSVTGSHQRL
jgi:hypothetical protein